MNWNHYLLGFRSKGNSCEMATVKQNRPWVRRSTSVLVGGGLALSACGLAGGIAQAAPAPAPSYHWCRTLGSPAAVGAAAATTTAVGAWGSADVEPDCQWLGILEQPNMDSDLTEHQLSP